jgi:transposase-like protein/IS1 family transposase
MVSHLFYYQLALLALIWLFIMLHLSWLRPSATHTTAPATPITPKRTRSTEPKAFAGLTHKPHCVLCEQATRETAPPPPVPPAPMPPTNRRPRTVDTSRHFCPHAKCDYRGWLELNNLRANGHPNGGPWRQFHCTSCNGYFLETHGTIFHGKQAEVELIVRVLACLAEGLGIRATARVFEVAPNTVLAWLVEAAEQLRAFSAHFLCKVHVNQLQLDELYTVLREVKAGEISEDEAITRLERSPYWVWTAMDPQSKLLVVIAVGTRTLEMAQRVVHQVVQVLAPGCVPLFLTDGFREYMTALLAHFGHWMQPERRQDKGPRPKPRWMPLPALLYAQVVKSYRRRRIVGVKHRVVFGTLEQVHQVLVACGRKINTAFVERLNLDIRQRVAAVGRRVNTLCQGEDGLRHQLTVYHAYYNFCLPHASLRQPLLVPEPTNGSGSAKVWRPCTPAMAAGLTDHVWSLKEVLLYRVPPWPQAQTA